jgi:hypothetical protein
LFDLGEVDEGLRLPARARDELEASPDPLAALWLAIVGSDVLLRLGKLEEATRIGLRGLDDARRHGWRAAMTRTSQRQRSRRPARPRPHLGSSRTDRPADHRPLDWVYIALHMGRSEIDLLCGEIDAAAHRLSQIELDTALGHALRLGQLVAEVALWAGGLRRPSRQSIGC